MTTPTPVMFFRDTVRPELLALPDHTYGGVFYYATGDYTWPTAQIKRFKLAGKRVHAIDTSGTGAEIADIVDVETGDLSPQDVPAWVDERWKHHSTAAVYCSRSVVPDVVSALDGRPSYLIVADWTGQPHIPQLTLPPHVILAGVQYANLPDFDLTAIYSRAWLEGAKIA